MRKFRHVNIFAAATAIFILAACANTKTLPRLNQDDRASLGRIGVVTVGPSVGGRVTGGVGESAAQGALQGAVGGSLNGALSAVIHCGPAAVLCGVLIVPAGLVLGGASGAVRGAINGIPGSTAAEIQAALIRSIADRDLQADLRRGVLQYADSADAGADLGAGTVTPAPSPDYASMAGNGIGAVLEISLTQVALEQKLISDATRAGNTPRLNLVMAARARIVRVPDGRVLWNAPEVAYESLAAQAATWTARDSDLMKTEIINGTEALTRQIGGALFGARGRAQAESKSRPEGVNSTVPSVRYLP
jgi:hypothetical protein